MLHERTSCGYECGIASEDTRARTHVCEGESSNHAAGEVEKRAPRGNASSSLPNTAESVVADVALRPVMKL